ncbi:hypothetical protein B0H17DRAFT_718354 [Mycena rosella]|uniref:Uncharacterized protein n=1 Tax=Mycena rosella TaxID=1033263 RepID=A0AAD7D9K9_MYCRO|nr:hypothetical protein B0H17DRAFT_718354 [Mycena rosella]
MPGSRRYTVPSRSPPRPLERRMERGWCHTGAAVRGYRHLHPSPDLEHVYTRRQPRRNSFGFRAPHLTPLSTVTCLLSARFRGYARGRGTIPTAALRLKALCAAACAIPPSRQRCSRPWVHLRRHPSPVVKDGRAGRAVARRRGRMSGVLTVRMHTWSSQRPRSRPLLRLALPISCGVSNTSAEAPTYSSQYQRRNGRERSRARSIERNTARNRGRMELYLMVFFLAGTRHGGGSLLDVRRPRP